MNNENQKHNGRGIFYGVIGVATLVVAIIGATFAYFTATANNNTVITGNMASINFDLSVQKVTNVDTTTGGMIPMTNGMIEAAVAAGTLNAGGTKKACQDGNGNAVCQIYKITVSNSGSVAGIFDGYVSLTGGSGTPADSGSAATNTTTMRWAQVFLTSGNEADGSAVYSTAGTQDLQYGGASTDASKIVYTAIDNERHDLKYANEFIKTATSEIQKTKELSGNTQTYIDKNFIRISDHKAGDAYTRATDTTSALVYSQNLPATNGEAVYYIAVWLSENDTKQNATTEIPGNATETSNFFSGDVTFYSSEGSEVSATFADYTSAVTPRG